MLSLHDLEDFMDTNAALAEQAKAAKRQEPSTVVQHNDDALKDGLKMDNAPDLLSVPDAYLKGVQSLLSALSAARQSR